MTSLCELCSPLSERQQPGSTSLQRLSAQRRRPLSALGTIQAANYQRVSASESPRDMFGGTVQQRSAGQQHSVSALRAGAPSNSDQNGQPASDNTAAGASAAEDLHAVPYLLPGATESASKTARRSNGGSAQRAVALKQEVPARDSSLGKVVMRSPFQSAQPPAEATRSSKQAGQARDVAQLSREPVVAQSQRQPISKPQGTGMITARHQALHVLAQRCASMAMVPIWADHWCCNAAVCKHSSYLNCFSCDCAL